MQIHIRLNAVVALSVFTLLVTLATPSFAQGTRLASCDETELTEDQKYQMQVCSSHLGCRMTLGIWKTCTRVKSFLGNLHDTVTRAGRRFAPQALETEDVFDARIDPRTRSIDSDPKVAHAAKMARESTARAGREPPVYIKEGESEYLWYGDVKDGRRLTNMGYAFFPRTGSAHRGDISGDWAREHHSSNDVREVYERRGIGGRAGPEGASHVGKFEKGKLVEGVWTSGNGVRWVGTFAEDGKLLNAKEFGPAGELLATYENGKKVGGEPPTPSATTMPQPSERREETPSASSEGLSTFLGILGTLATGAVQHEASRRMQNAQRQAEGAQNRDLQSWQEKPPTRVDRCRPAPGAPPCTNNLN